MTHCVKCHEEIQNDQAYMFARGIPDTVGCYFGDTSYVQFNGNIVMMMFCKNCFKKQIKQIAPKVTKKILDDIGKTFTPAGITVGEFDGVMYKNISFKMEEEKQ